MCILCDPTKVRRYVLWPPLGMLKFNVNGATRGKPVPVGIGVSPHNDKGGVLFMYPKHVGVCDSNEAEVLAILKALHCFSRFF